MSEELLIRQCSPTLAGIKTGNLFTAAYSDRNELFGELRDINRRLGSKGLRILPVKLCKSKALIYLYRPNRLKDDLRDSAACRILESRGYSTESPEACVGKLMKKLKAGEDFPHEIGLFLGYPPADVEGFIENKALNYKFSGCWKVYGDADKARETFDRYKKCSRVYYDRWSGGRSVETLTVTN